MIVTAFPLFLGLWGFIVEEPIYLKRGGGQMLNHFGFSMVADL